MHQNYEYYAHNKTAEHTCCIRVATCNCLLALCAQACALMYSKVTWVRRMRSGSRRRHVSAATLGGAATMWRTGRQSVALTCSLKGEKCKSPRKKVYAPGPVQRLTSSTQLYRSLVHGRSQWFSSVNKLEMCIILPSNIVMTVVCDKQSHRHG